MINSNLLGLILTGKFQIVLRSLYSCKTPSLSTYNSYKLPAFINKISLLKPLVLTKVEIENVLT